jgi:hypothetical protein
MIKSEKTVSPETPSPDCWGKSPDCLALRVEPERGGIFLLRYLHLAFSHYVPGEDHDDLVLAFTTHAVTLKGRGLRALLPDLQTESLEYVRAIPDRYHAIQGPDGVAVFSITVEPSSSGDGEE